MEKQTFEKALSLQTEIQTFQESLDRARNCLSAEANLRSRREIENLVLNFYGTYAEKSTTLYYPDSVEFFSWYCERVEKVVADLQKQFAEL